MGSPRRGRPPASQVTPREREVLRLLDLGLTNAEMAALLRVSIRTVESHVASLMRKFDVHQRRLLTAQRVCSTLAEAAVDSTFASGEPRAPINTAYLDRAGVIVAVNASWRQFCLDNDGDPSTCGAGSSYLDACRSDSDRHSSVVAGYIRLAVRGGMFVPLQTRIPCHSPTQQRYYDVLVSSRVDDDGECVGATVSLSQAHRPRIAAS